MPSIEFTHELHDALDAMFYDLIAEGSKVSRQSLRDVLALMDVAVPDQAPKITLPGPDGLPDQEVPLDGDFEHLTAAWDA